jgi:hypothetical protein
VVTGGTTFWQSRPRGIAVRELDPAAHLALKYNQLTSERGILSLKSADRPERRK